MEDFVEILKELVESTGLSLRKLQDASNVTASQYSRYLKGSIPTIAVTIKIAKHFNCSMDYLFGLSSRKNGRKYEGYNYDMSNFVDRYKELLNNNHISHFKFAQNNMFNESIIRHWKSGKIPRLDIIYTIAKNLGGSIDELIGRQ